MSQLVDYYLENYDAPNGALWMTFATDERLESSHDYIQWMFPLPEPSRAVPWSPVMTGSDIDTFRTDPVILDRMRVSLARMVLFYARTVDWKESDDHNHLRITRIIRSLTVVGLRDEAVAFRAWILRQGPDATPTTLGFWERATQ